MFVQCTRLAGKRAIMRNDEIFNRDSLSCLEMTDDV